MQFTTQVLVAILATTATAQSIDFASLTGAAASKVSSYMAQVTKEPEYASVASVASTAVKTKWQQSFLSGDLAKVSQKSWYGALPSDIKSFAQSVQSEVLKIATGDASAATVTTASTSTSPSSASSTSAASASKSGLVSNTAVNAASTSGVSASKSGSSSTSKTSTSAATATKNGAVETGVGRMIGVAAAGALGALIL